MFEGYANAPTAMPVPSTAAGDPQDRSYPGQHVFVEFTVGLGNSRVHVEQYMPLGVDRTESLAHIEALIIQPGLAMANTLFAAYFQQLVYAMGAPDLDNNGV